MQDFTTKLGILFISITPPGYSLMRHKITLNDLGVMKRQTIGFLLLCVAHNAIGGTPAIVTTPIADLTGERQTNLPICFKKGYDACPRIHQLLLHETVIIVEQQKKLVCIETPHLYFQTEDGAKHNRFWTEKKSITPLSSIQDHTKLPSRNNQKVILLRPFASKSNKRAFSMGTQFVVQAATPKTTTVYWYDAPKQTHRTLTIPNTHLHTIGARQNKRALMVKLLKQIAHMPGYTPYVWGGCSMSTRYPSLDYGITTISEKPERSYYTLKGRHPIPHTGFDCAGLIMRCAECAGISFPYKNTVTLKRNLKLIGKDERITAGDLILLPGHVIAISDVANNLGIEARAKQHGYGFVHEIALKKLFKNIETYEDLKRAYLSGKPVERLDRDGKTLAWVPIKILKLPTA